MKARTTTPGEGAAVPDASRVAGLLVTCALTVAGFVAWTWPLATHLSTHTLSRAGAADAKTSGDGWELILANDQNLSLWSAADNARALLRGDWLGLVHQGQCYPMPKATLLGEHMIEFGVLAAPWLLLTGDPVVAYNLSLLTALVIAASGMFLFLSRHTGSAAAAVAGALAFAFATPRLVDLPYHPAVIGTHWIPWVLWSFDGVLAGAGIGAAVALGVTLLLASLVGSYPLMAVGVVGAAYAAVAIVQGLRRGERPVAAVAMCIVAATPAVVVIGSLLADYARLQHDWLLATNTDAKFLGAVADYLPGGLLSVGATALAGVALLLVPDRESRRGSLLPLVVATAAALVLATSFGLPGGHHWSLYETLAHSFPLLDGVRGPGKVGLAVGFGLQALGAIGWGRMMRRLDSGPATLLAAALVTLTLVEVSPPAWTANVLGTGAPMQLREIAPPRRRIDALLGAMHGSGGRVAVLDLPTGRMVRAPLELLDAAYHGHPTSACYNSLIPPTMREVYAMAARGHSERGVAELAAAGFGFVIERPTAATVPLSTTSFPPPARLVAFEEDVAVWSLPAPVATTHDMTTLAMVATGGASRAATFAPDSPHELDVEVTNRGAVMWALAQPVTPLLADLELAAPDGSVVFRSRARGVLPLALSPGATVTVQLAMPTAPPAGSWRASIRIDGAPEATAAADFRWSDDGR